ncbi:MAG: Metallo-dependent phosphatase-like protein [Piptocephalis tieghemiana]|nr:MAG: Metallo-dependent phosphatase-like protein [Piptocephalis tieghemiana]
MKASLRPVPAPLVTTKDPFALYTPAYTPPSSPLPPAKVLSPNLTIIHTNDIHAHMDSFSEHGTECSDQEIASYTCYGGAARLHTVVERLRKEHPNALLFDAGDQFQGTMYYTHYKGSITAEFMNEMMRYDLTTLGNHEFDDGPEHLADFLGLLKFPVVTSNMNVTKHPRLSKVIRPYHLFPEHGLAVIGFITNTTGYISNSGPDITFPDAIPIVQQHINDIRDLGYQRIIAVSHNGYKEDQYVASQTSGLDLIVGGHSHTYLSPDLEEKNPLSKGLYPTRVTGKDGEDTYVVQAYKWGQYVGHLDLEFTPEGRIASISGQPINVNNTIKADPPTLARVAQWREAFETENRVVIGNVTQAYSFDECRETECEIASFMCDVILKHRRPSGSQGCILHGGAVRSGFNKGNITVGHIRTMLPFGDHIMDVELSGSKLYETVENAIEGHRQDTGEKIATTLQTSGFEIQYDPKAPAYQRIRSLRILESYLGDQETYQITTVQFITVGGDGLLRGDFKEHDTQDDLAAVIRSYITKHSPLTFPVPGKRIQTV